MYRRPLSLIAVVLFTLSCSPRGRVELSHPRVPGKIPVDRRTSVLITQAIDHLGGPISRPDLNFQEVPAIFARIPSKNDSLEVVITPTFVRLDGTWYSDPLISDLWTLVSRTYFSRDWVVDAISGGERSYLRARDFRLEKELTRQDAAELASVMKESISAWGDLGDFFPSPVPPSIPYRELVVEMGGVDLTMTVINDEFVAIDFPQAPWWAYRLDRRLADWIDGKLPKPVFPRDDLRYLFSATSGSLRRSGENAGEIHNPLPYVRLINDAHPLQSPDKPFDTGASEVLAVFTVDGIPEEVYVSGDFLFYQGRYYNAGGIASRLINAVATLPY